MNSSSDTTSIVNGVYIQVFAPFRRRADVVDALNELIELGVVGCIDFVVVGASSGFMFRSADIPFADDIYALSIDDAESLTSQQARAVAFASEASKYRQIVCVYSPGQMATVELEAFIRACNKNVAIVGIP